MNDLAPAHPSALSSWLGGMRTRDRTDLGLGLARLTVGNDSLRLGLSLWPTSRHRFVARDELVALRRVTIWWGGEFIGIVAPGAQLNGYLFSPIHRTECHAALVADGWSIGETLWSYETFRGLL